PASWPDAFAEAARHLAGVAGDRIGAVAGDLCDVESMAALKDLMGALGSANLDCRQDGGQLDASRRDFYLFNSGITGIDEVDAILIIGANPRTEAPVLNARVRRAWLRGVPIAIIGAAADLTYGARHLGDGPDTLRTLLGGSHEFAKTLKDAKRPMVILGAAATARGDGAAVLAAAWTLARDVGAMSEEWHGFNVLHHAAARVGALDLGFLPGPGGRGFPQMMGGGVDVLWLLGADEFNTDRIGRDTFVIYQGHHGDRGAARADLILPGAAYTEKHGTYVNTEGRVQRGAQAIFPPGEAREDWTIARALSEVMGRTLPYDDLTALRERIEAANPVFGRIGFLPRFGCIDPTGPAGGTASFGEAPFRAAFATYYQTDPISRASPTMAECVAALTPPVLAAAE
ncbi:MAG: molybdopterin-dependent oxidoreductase, partial [Acetobacteraceae bacterium]